MIASKYSFLGGFSGTSNVYSGYLVGQPVVGTQAHSFIMSFESEDDIKNSRAVMAMSSNQSVWELEVREIMFVT